MAPVTELQKIYIEQMKRHGFGVPLYEPVPQELIKPGDVGYLDQHCRWVPIVNLGDAAAVQRLGLSMPTEPLQEAPDDANTSWGPKCSESVRWSRVNLTGGVDAEAAGIPVGATVAFKYRSDSGTGAILLTEAPILRKRMYYDDPFRQWVEANAAKLLLIRPEIKDYGLYCVQWTYSTIGSSINVWTSKEREITVGFKAKVVGAGEVGPSGEWFESSTDEGWMHSRATGNGRMVVFFGGLLFHFGGIFKRTIRESKPRPLWTLRGGLSVHRTVATVDLLDDDACEVTCTRIGNLDLKREEEDDADF